MIHAYFGSLPMGTAFTHQGKQYTKIGEERATDSKGKSWVFEIHYGCLVPNSMHGKVETRPN